MYKGLRGLHPSWKSERSLWPNNSLETLRAATKVRVIVAMVVVAQEAALAEEDLLGVIQNAPMASATHLNRQTQVFVPRTANRPWLDYIAPW